MKNLMVFDHPMIQHKMSLMRDKDTPSKVFRELVHEVSMLMAFEVMRDLPLESYELETPLDVYKRQPSRCLGSVGSIMDIRSW